MYEIIKYINNNITQKLVMSEIADMAGYSTWHFCEKFKAITSMTFSEYIQNRRIQLAAREILKGRKIVDVSIDFGYSDPSGFNKAFAKQYGCSPSQYKKNYFHYEARYKEQQNHIHPLSTRCALLKETVLRESIPSPVLPQCSSIHECFLSAHPAISPYDLLAGEFYPPRKPEKIQKCHLTEKENKMLQEETISLSLAGKKEFVFDYSGILGMGFSRIHNLLVHSGDIADPELINVAASANSIGTFYKAEAERKQKCSQSSNELFSLQRIAETAKKIPSAPACSFAEALQSLTFAHMLNTADDVYSNSSSSIGRLDQLLYPYYRNDLSSGFMDDEKVEELLICFFLKLYHAGSSGMFTIGGGGLDTDSAGMESTQNELTYRILHALERLNLDIPFAFRYSRNTDKELFIAVLKYAGKLQGKYPLFVCDDINIPALIESGVHEEEALEYCLTESYDLVIPGKTMTGSIRVQCNLLKAVESVFQNMDLEEFPADAASYKSLSKSNYSILSTSQYATFDLFLQAIYQAIERIIRTACTVCRNNVSSCLVSGYKCILNGSSAIVHHVSENRIFDKHAKYLFNSIVLTGIPNLIDSLCAVRYLIFENALTTMEELAWHMKQDFPDEEYRRILLDKPPKYGNNIPEVNQMAEQVMNFVCSCIKKYNTPTLALRPQIISFETFQEQDTEKTLIRNCNATPDGRHKGEVIAAGLSPAAGRDFNGLTALLQSFTALPTIDATGGTYAAVILDPYLLNEINLSRIADIILSISPNGLSCLRIEVTDPDTLKASAMPEYEPKYPIHSDRTNSFTIF